jgi:hypothetical protein
MVLPVLFCAISSFRHPGVMATRRDPTPELIWQISTIQLILQEIVTKVTTTQG